MTLFIKITYNKDVIITSYSEYHIKWKIRTLMVDQSSLQEHCVFRARFYGKLPATIQERTIILLLLSFRNATHTSFKSLAIDRPLSPNCGFSPRASLDHRLPPVGWTSHGFAPLISREELQLCSLLLPLWITISTARSLNSCSYTRCILFSFRRNMQKELSSGRSFKAGDGFALATSCFATLIGRRPLCRAGKKRSFGL